MDVLTVNQDTNVILLTLLFVLTLIETIMYKAKGVMEEVMIMEEMMITVEMEEDLVFVPPVPTLIEILIVNVPVNLVTSKKE